jgi:cytoskeletal protein CcmA (bactofilin family)
MLFNKKPEEEPAHDYSAVKRAVAMSAATETITAPARKPNGGPTRSVIDAWLKITGNLESEGEVQVDGKIDGDIRCAHLTVGRDATVAGNITADEVVVRGNVKGVIRANRVILQDSAHVESEVFHKKLSIEEGACFEGNSRRCDDPMNAEAQVPAAALEAMAAEMKSANKTNGKYGETGVIAA